MTSETLTVPPEKSPRRRRALKVLAWIGVGLGFLVAALVIASAIWNMTASRRLDAALAAIRASGDPATSEEMAAAYRRNLPATNAAPYYQAAFALAGGFACDSGDPGYGLPIVGTGAVINLEETPSPETLQLAQDYLAGKRECLDLLRKAGSMDRCAFPVELEKGFAMPLPQVAKLRQTARLFKLKNVVDVAQGKADEAVDDAVQTFRISRAVGNDPILISGLVRVAVLAMAAAETERTLSYLPLSNDQLGRLASAASAQMDITEMRPFFVGERAAGASLCLSLAREPERVQELIAAGDSSTDFVPPGGRMLAGLWKDNGVAYIDLMNGVIEAVAHPPREALRKSQEVDAGLAQLASRRSPRMIMSSLLLPALGAAVKKFVGGHESLLLTQAACAVEMYRNDKGQLPESLDALVPQYLPAVPEDAFAEGKIRYAKEAKGYRLWSVGPDGKDNGGTLLQNPPQREGSDIVFRVLR